MKYDDIFTYYISKENVPFYILNRKIEFPTDRSLEIYEKMYINTNIPWTTLSYKIYNSVEYWWVLSALNTKHIFYAAENSEIYYIKPEYLSDILNNING